jgi:hypothetical protein
VSVDFLRSARGLLRGRAGSDAPDQGQTSHLQDGARTFPRQRRTGR